MTNLDFTYPFDGVGGDFDGWMDLIIDGQLRDRVNIRNLTRNDNTSTKTTWFKNIPVTPGKHEFTIKETNTPVGVFAGHGFFNASNQRVKITVSNSSGFTWSMGNECIDKQRTAEDPDLLLGCESIHATIDVPDIKNINPNLIQISGQLESTILVEPNQEINNLKGSYNVENNADIPIIINDTLNNNFEISPGQSKEVTINQDELLESFEVTASQSVLGQLIQITSKKINVEKTIIDRSETKKIDSIKKWLQAFPDGTAIFTIRVFYTVDNTSSNFDAINEVMINYFGLTTETTVTPPGTTRKYVIEHTILESLSALQSTRGTINSEDFEIDEFFKIDGFISGEPPQLEEPDQEPSEPGESGSNNGLIIGAIAAAAGVGGGLLLHFSRKKKRK